MKVACTVLRRGGNCEISSLSDYIELDKNVFLNMEIKNCDFSYICPLKWNNLDKTDDTDIRYCTECNENVYRVYDKNEFNKMANKERCVFIESNTKRKLLGRPAFILYTDDIAIPEYMRAQID